MDVAQKRTSDSRGWTLLHCAAAGGNSSKTIKTLMDKFPKDEKWHYLLCQAADGKTALHIAVAEGDVKTVIILLDEAADDCTNLLDARDNNNCYPANYTTESSLLQQLLITVRTVNSSSLHELAKKGDRHLVGLRLDNLCNTTPEAEINKKDEQGMTALHVAVKTISIEVLEVFFQSLSHEELMRCILKPTPDGDTALHLAAQSNCPMILWMLLNEIKREEREEFLYKTNDKAESVYCIGGQQNFIDDLLMCKYNIH